MPRPIEQILHHVRAVVADPKISGTLIQTEDLSVLCDAAEDAARLRAALGPFAYYYDVNDCTERDRRGALEVPIDDLRNAKLALEQNNGDT